MATVVNESRPENTVATDERIRAALARLLQDRLVRESRLGVWVHPILIVVIVALAWPDAPHDLLLGWAGAVVFTALLRGAWLFICSHRPLTERAVRNGVRATVTLLAITWGVGGALVLPIVPFETTALLLVVLAGLIASALTTLAADPLSVRGFLAGITLPVFVSLATSDQSHHLAAAIVVAMFTLGMAIVARRAHLTLVDHLQGTARPAAGEKHLELLAEVAADVPRGVRGDPTRVRQVLMNLIGNAIKFTEQGEVVISVSAAASDGNVALTFLVRDTGIGIAAEHVASVFKEFTQADSTMTRRYGGTGLGLAISQRLVRLMGGELTVKSVVGRGSEFSFSLALPVETSPPTRLVGLAALGGRRMLIVDDNQTNRRILREMLAAEGIKVDEASTAADGLEALRRVRYDLAILDVQMPDMDGFQLATAVRADKKIKGTNLLMLTSAGQRGDGERCRELGIRGYLTKPISRSDLLEALGTVLAGPPGEAGTPEVVTRHTIAESRATLRVLLAEDNPVNQQVAVAMLVKRGHEVHVSSNGREALQAVQERDYDVVLMDIQMPEMDGFEATHAIRALAKGKDLPIIGPTAQHLSGEPEGRL